MLVTALESNVDVPKMELVTERLLHEERKLKGKADWRESHGSGQKYKKKGPKSTTVEAWPHQEELQECY